MNRRQVTLLVFVVILVHAALFWALSGIHPVSQKPYVPPIAPPNFAAKEAKWIDETTGEAMVYREFRVSTRLSETEAPTPHQAPGDTPPSSAPLPSLQPTFTP